MRRGKSADARGAERLVAETLATATEVGCTGTRVLRADSQFYNADVVAACRRNGTHFSVTTGMNPSIKPAIAAIPDSAWRQIRYPTGVVDPDTGEMIYNAEVAEISACTAFTDRKKAEQHTARLIVRRVRDLAKPAARGDQGELFPAWRYHPLFTDSPFAMLEAETQHRHHAVIEQVIADGKAGPLAHLPSGDWGANTAWLILWAISYNLRRARAPPNTWKSWADQPIAPAHRQRAGPSPKRKMSKDHHSPFTGGSRLRANAVRLAVCVAGQAGDRDLDGCFVGAVVEVAAYGAERHWP